MPASSLVRYAATLLLVLAGVFDVAAGTFTLFGPRTFTRATGAPQTERVAFPAPSAGGSVLRVESDGVASAVVTLNGATVLQPADFKPSVSSFDRELALVEANVLTVELRSKPGSWLRLSIIRDDERPPTIRATAIPAADAAGWNNQDVTITFTCSDAESGLTVCPTPITVSAEGAGQVLSGEAVDGAGNRASVSATLNIDKTAPLVTLATSPNANANGWNNGDVTVSVSCADALSGVHACPGPQVVSREGASQVVMVQVSDIAGSTASASATVNIDRTAPHIVASLSAPANTTGWHNTPLSVTFTCEDHLAQIASCPAPVTVNGEGADQLITGIARDRADNSAAVAVRVSVDVTAPIVRAILSPVVENGWHNGEVTVSFVCEDGGSGVAECPTDRTVASEGADQAVTVTVADRAGNATTTTATVNIDRTAPTITTSVSGSPNAAGWHRSAVTVAFECADDRSGVTSCTEPVTVSTEGRSQIVTGVAFDAAGNRSVATVALNIDTTPPVIQSALTPPGLWANISVQVGFQCTDHGSGIATCTPAQTVTTEGVSQRIEGRATDQAGNEAVATATVSIDRTPPVITPSVSPAANAQGWHRTNPTVSFACSDDASGVADCSAPHVVTEEGRGSIVVGSVRDVAGNTATASNTVNMDRTAPTVSVTSPAAGALVRTSPVVVTGSAADAVAGLAGIVCNGSPAGLTGALFSCEAGLLPGADDLTVTVTDAAGNIGTSVLAINFDPNDSPIARPGGPYNAETATAVTYNGASSFDPDGGTLTFAWEFGDGGTATGPSPSHAYESAGTFIVRLTVRDPEGASHVATTTAVIVRANGNPVANAGGPYATDAGVPVNFDASASTDPDTDVLTYSWDFGDGGVGSGQRPRRTYVNPGVFTATLTVTDGRGGRHTAHTQVTIRTANQNPIAAAGGPYEGSATQAVTFSGAASHDPDNDPLTYAWSFGDGATANGQDASHRYEAAGHYNVSLTVTDGRGGSHSAGTQVTIATSNTAPIAHVGGPYSGRRGRAIAFSGSGSSDPDNDALTYAWSFGDGRGRTGANAEHTYDAPGTYTVTLTVDDGRGGTDATSTSVKIAETTTDDNRAPTAVAGGPYSGEAGVPVIFSATASSDPDGDAVQFAWSFGDGTSASGPTPQHAYVQANAYTVTLTVTDAHGASQVATSSAIISAQADRAPPSVRVSGPSQVLPGTEVTISAFVDDIGTVTSVIFEVEGGQNTTVQTPPYQRRLLIPPVGSPGDTILVKAIATDGAGNIGTGSLLLTIASLPDSTAPVVRIVTPVETAAGAMLRVGATATDAAGVAAVTFRINGVEAPTSGPPYYATYQVPADMAVGANVGVVVEAVDFAGNRATAEAAITVASAGDTTPPIVTIVAPATARAGTNVALLAHASDAGGLSAVAILVNGIAISTLDAPPYQATYHVPDSVVAGMRLQIESRAVDFAGLQTIAISAIEIVNAGAAAGVITGEVYDDSNGLPLPGATVTMAGSDAAPGPSVTTDARGRYLMGVEPGDGLVHITKEGWTRVDRPVTIQSGQALELFDARLLPLSANSRSIAPVLGGTLEANGVSLSIAAGAVTAPTMLTLTRVGPQGLQGMLPAGWSPVIAFDIAPAGVDFAFPALVQAPRNAVAPGTKLWLAAWDPQRGAWRAVVEAVAGPDVEPLPATLDASSQYAWLRADAAPATPPAAVIGELLAGVPLPQVPDAVQTLVNPQPKVIFYKPGVRSDVVGSVSLTAPLSSGTRLWSRLTESYQFFSKAEIRPEPFVQDLVFFQSPDDDGKLLSSYPVTPSIVFEALTLERGVISVELIAPPEGEPDAGFIDQSGGQATTASGERLEITAGLTTAPIAARVTKLTAADIGAPVPPGFELIGAVAVSLSGGTLSGSGALSVPRPDGLGDTVQILLARAETVQGETKLVLVGLGRVAGDRVVSEAILPKNKIALEGVRTGGRYVFLRPLTSVGFVAGQVLGPQGLPFAGAQVGSDRLAIISLSRAAGAYVAAAAIGTVKLTALDLQKADTGFGQGSLAAAGDERAMDLRLVAQPPRVVSVSPAHGARNVAPSDPIVVLFSEPIQPASLTGHVRLAAGDTLADVASNLTANNTTLTLRPAQPLSANAVYTLTLEKMKDLSGYELPAPLSVQFSTVDTTAPAPPAAGSISASIPEDGTTTVRGTQGTAGAHDTVTVENISRGTSTPVLLDPNGGFTVLLSATAKDKLRLSIVDAAGNETTVDVPRFSQTNADGSISTTVGPEGGRVTGAGGEIVDVPDGAFPDGTVVTVKTVAEQDFPVQLSAEDRQNFTFTAGIRIDLGGQTPLKYLNVGIPIAGSETEDDQWIVTQAVEAPGQSRLNVVDTARVIGSFIVTSSPPCPGVTASGTYGFLRPGRPVGVLHGVLDRGLPAALFAPFLMPGILAMPYGLNANYVVGQLDAPVVCLPTLSGAVTVSANRVVITLPERALTDSDIELMITNITRSKNGEGMTRVFAPFGRTISVEGSATDAFTVVAVDFRGNLRLIDATVAERPYVRVTVTGLVGGDSRVVVTNETRKVTQSVLYNGLSGVPSVRLLLEGTPSDEYSVRIDGTSPRKQAPSLITAYQLGPGNLIARASFGSIDPTLAEIQTINAQLPASAPPIVENGVTRVLLQNDTQRTDSVLLDVSGNVNRIVGGAFAFPFEGNLSDTYKLKIEYERGNQHLIPIPNFRINVTDPDTGTVLRQVIGQTPPRGEPLAIDLGPPGAEEPSLSFNTAVFYRRDPTLPIAVKFSTPLDTATVNAMAVFDSSGIKVAGKWLLSTDGKTATFHSGTTLHFDTTYYVSLNGVRDARGRLLPTKPVPFTTLTPVRLGRVVLDNEGVVIPVRDIGFLRQPIANGETRTTVVAVSGNQQGNKLHTIDVTEPRLPKEISHVPGGWFKRRVTLLHARSDAIRIQYDVQLVPQPNKESCWAASAAMIVGWGNQESIDPKQIGNLDVVFQGYDKTMFDKWNLVPEPLQSNTVPMFHDMLERYGPLWVASRVPGLHVRVITGMWGDGTPEGTFLQINDPQQERGMVDFATNRGRQYALRFSEFVEQQESLVRLYHGVDIIPFFQEGCDSGDEEMCKPLNDPIRVVHMQQCTAGNEASCQAANIPGLRGSYIAHLREKPSWVPPPVVGVFPIRGPVNPDCQANVANSSFVGDLAVTNQWNIDGNGVSFYDITDPARPCHLGGKTLTANPERLNNVTRPGTFHVDGFAAGLATIKHSSGFAAYVAAVQAGVFSADIGSNIPAPIPANRLIGGAYSGDMIDVATFRDRVLALNNNFGGNASLDILTADLAPVTSVDLGAFRPILGGNPNKVRRLITARGVRVDRNQNGAVETDEVFDFAFVGGSGGVVIVDISDLDGPIVAGRVTMPGIIFQLDIDEFGQFLLAGGDRTEVNDSNDGVFLIDLANLFAPPAVDETNTDTRVSYVLPYPGGVNGFKVDTAKGRIYVGWPGIAPNSGGVDVWAFARRGLDNLAPVANAGPDRLVASAERVTLDGSNSFDPERDALSFEWTVLSGPKISLSNSSSARPTFDVPRDTPGGVEWVFQLTVADGMDVSAPDTVVIRLAEAKLHLTPVVIPFLHENTVTQLNVELDENDQRSDVTADPATTYEWVFGTSSIPELDSLARLIWSLIAQKAQLPPLPVKIAEIEVSPTGMLVAKSKGINVVRARHKNTVSGFSVVLVGIELKEIDLEPQSLFTKGAALFMKNPPLILTKKGNGLGLFSDTGTVLLADAKFEFLGSGIYLSASDLAAAMRPAIATALTKALGGNPAIGAFATWALAKLAGLAGTQFLDPFGPEDPGLIAPTSVGIPFQGAFEGLQPGTTNIAGTLDLGAFGKASDSVLAVVLPDVTSVEVDPQETWLDAGSPREPGGAVRTFARVTIAASSHTIEVLNKEIPVPDEAEGARRALAKFVPKISADVNARVQFDKRFSFFDGFRLAFKANTDTNCVLGIEKLICTVQFSEMEIGFHVPVTLEPLITVEYGKERPTLFELTRDGVTNAFDTMVRHNGTAGVSKLSSTVSMFLLGSATDPDGRVVVVDQDSDTPPGGSPQLRKELLGAVGPVVPGETRTYKVTFGNPMDTTLENVVISDVLTLNGDEISRQLIQVGTVDPHQSKVFEIPVTIPNGKGLLVNTVMCVNPTCIRPPPVARPLLGFPIINEIVAEPQQDWNGDGATNAADQWIEIITSAGKEELRGWRLEYADPDGADHAFVIDPDDPRITLADDLKRVTIRGLDVPIAAKATLKLRAYQPVGLGPIVDEVAISGAATSVDDEAFARVPDAVDQDSPNDFRRQKATRGEPNQ